MTTAAAQPATAAMAPGSTGPGGSGPDSHALAATAATAATATDAYFSYLGFVCGAYHIEYCVKGVTAAITCGLGLAGWPQATAITTNQEHTSARPPAAAREPDPAQ